MNFCTSCGQPRTPDARFCTSCGAAFVADSGDEQASPPAEPQFAPEQAWDTPQEAWAPPQEAPAEQQEPAAGQQEPAAEQEPAAGQPGPAEPQQEEPSAPAQQEEPWAPPPQEAWAPPQDEPTPPQGTWMPQQDAPAPPRDAVPAEQDTLASQQDTLASQQDTWAPQQETWAAQPGAGYAAQPGAPLGADPNAPDDPFGHLFRGGPAAPAGPEAGFGGPPGPGYGETAVGQPPYSGGPPAGGPPWEPPPSRNRARTITLLAGVVVVLVAGGVGAWAALGGKGQPSAQPTHSAHPASTAPHTSPKPSTSVPSTSAAPSHKHSGIVAAAPSVRGKNDERAVVAFLNDYFASINTHNYQRYYGLLDAQQQSQVSQAKFDTGYRKSRDSHATLVALGPAGGGVTAASVTFTSHQPASDSPSKTSCTTWSTTLYLRHQGSSYVIGAPPASYHASYQAC